jgi:hypothetical protein
VSIVPYAPGDPFGDFQSDPGTGVSAPITITFSQPVTSVTITIEDPTYAGNAMTAYRPDGSIAGSVSFTGSGIPGIDIPDTQTITADGIVRIVLTPAPLDYVAYAGLTFTPGPSGLCKDSKGNPVPCPDMNVVLKWLQDSLNEPVADGNCARQCNHALGAGGMDTLARPIFRAYLYGRTLRAEAHNWWPPRPQRTTCPNVATSRWSIGTEKIMQMATWQSMTGAIGCPQPYR